MYRHFKHLTCSGRDAPKALASRLTDPVTGLEDVHG